MESGIRRVTVEFLRRGPRHNQLLSPLTDYLAVCGDFPGGVVHVPYEQADVHNLLDDLRYTVAALETSDRLAVTRGRAGADLAAMLADVPGLAGVLAGEHPDATALTHLRIVISASELALLPFELAKVPIGAGSVGDDWLALQPDRPVCLTRHVRGVASYGSTWPTRPRILFVCGDDVPFEQHLDVFERVLEPWRIDGIAPDPGEDGAPAPDEHITVLRSATLDRIRAAVTQQAFTHVHVLAHGAEIEQRRSVRHGVALGDRVVTGGELALALASNVDGRRRLPAVVTLASCDSAAQGSVVTPGGSVAHDLHASGIPLVVASQFPISEEASIPFAETFYRGQLTGEHPLVTVCEMRRQLATQFNDEHAWASIVVYEALPGNFDEQLDELCYWQSRRALDVALARLERTATSDAERLANLERSGAPFADEFASPTVEQQAALVRAVEQATTRLPSSGPYAADCDGLRAAAAKRTSEIAYWLALAPDVTATRQAELFERCFAELARALELYTSTMRALLTDTSERVQRKATVHWIVGQVMLLRAILCEPDDSDLAGVARLTAKLDLDHPDPTVRGWATVSMIEHTILGLAASGPSQEASDRAVALAAELVRITGEDSEQVTSTARQMRRFVSWWGELSFVEALAAWGIERRVAWDGEHGVVATARAVQHVLAPPRRTRPAGPRPATNAAPTTAVVAARPIPTQTPAPPTETEQRSGRFEIEMLPARNGDCLWLAYGLDGETSHVLIDCGSADAAGPAAERVSGVGSVELFVLTHIDADHISGAIPLFGDEAVAARFEDVWFNGWEQLRGFLSVRQGEQFSALLARDERPFRWNGSERADDPPPPIVTDGHDLPSVELPGGLRLTVMSPSRSGLRALARNWHAALLDLDPQRALLARRARPAPPATPSGLDLDALAASGPTKDTSIPNLSSIAFLAEFGGRAVLFTGDAHADVLLSSIRSLQAARGKAGERLQLDALKLSHHGSANATTRELLEEIECSNYLVPTDGSIFYHPDREAIARVIVHGGPAPTLHFNYRTDLNDFWGDPILQERYGYTARYPEADAGLGVCL